MSSSRQIIKSNSGVRDESNPPYIPIPQPDALPHRGRQRERTPHAAQRYSNEDVTMDSPLKDPIPAYGSSRSMQGILRGRAAGNTFNVGDVGAVWDNINKYNTYLDK